MTTEIWEGDIVRAGGREGMVVAVKERPREVASPFAGASPLYLYLVQFPDDQKWWYTWREVEPVLVGEYV